MIIKRKIPKKTQALEALEKIISITNEDFLVLDIGSGHKEIHANIFRDNGYTVDTVDFFDGSTFKGDFNRLDIPKNYDIIWLSHCLEHQLNVNIFLKKIYDTLKIDGYLAVTVPPLKHQIVGGHVSLWNAGLLIYNLVLAGFDCSDVMIKSYGYNISAIVRKTKNRVSLENLVYDTQDLVILNKYFPKNLSYENHCFFDGNISEYNWHER